jgi:hypothetical protein
MSIQELSIALGRKPHANKPTKPPILALNQEKHDDGSKVIYLKLFTRQYYIVVARYANSPTRKAICIFDNPFDSYDFIEDWTTTN